MKRQRKMLIGWKQIFRIISCRCRDFPQGVSIMKKLFFPRIALAAWMLTFVAVSVVAAFAQTYNEGHDTSSKNLEINVREGQVIRFSLSADDRQNVVVVNPTDLAGDIDIQAF